ncbi:MAG: GNAT family N-acetyltransferase [Chitinispirillaceae bacterium]
MSIDLSIVNNHRDFVSLVPQWNQLSECSSDATPFQLPEWVLPWWEEFGNDGLKVVRALDENRLVGLGLFFTYNDSSKQKLCFIGSGISDYLDLVMHPEYRSSFPDEIIRYLSGCGDWDQCDFQEQKEGASLLGVSVPSSIRACSSVQSVCPYVKMPGDREALLKTLPKNMEKNIRRSVNRARRMGKVVFERADPGRFEEFMDDLVRLHGDRWKSRSCEGVISGRQIEKFYRSAGLGLMNRGVLNLYRLKVGNRVCAAFYFLTYKRRTYAYLAGFDPEMEFCSPGTLGIYFSMREEIKRGSEVFDFLRGAESYKYHWGAQDRTNCRILLEHRS